MCWEETGTSIVSVYAPTHRSSQEDKDKFFADLQNVIDGISNSLRLSDVLMMELIG